MTHSSVSASSSRAESANLDQAESFSEVLSELDKSRLPLLGREVFQRTQLRLTPAEGELVPTDDAAPVVDEPLFGSYHVLFPLTFRNGLRWLIKIPINGTAKKWDDVSALSLVAEAHTMQLLRRATTIPLPDVLDFSSITQNTLGCPYIMLSYIDGLPLYDVWFGHRLKGHDVEVVRERRIRVLEGIASAMMQLDKYSSDTSGSLFFIGDYLLHTGPARRVDHKAMLDRWFVDRDLSDDPIYISQARCSDPKAFYTFMQDLHPEKKPLGQGLVALLRLLISWIPEPSRPDRFVLAHPDFDIQNFIVAEDGELRGIIDWDGVAAVPRSIGNERYPGWLTRDWDPMTYGYEESMERGVEPRGVWEDSPSCLAEYRLVYRDAIAKIRGHAQNTRSSDAREDDDDETTPAGCMEQHDHRAPASCRKIDTAIDLCRNSLIAENLAIAAEDPTCRDGILKRVTQEIWVRAGQEEKLDFIELVDSFAEEKVDASVMDALRRGFEVLLAEGGL